MRLRSVARAVSVCSGLVAMLALGATPGYAGPPTEQDHYHNDFTLLLPTPEDIANGETTFCGLTDVPLHGTEDGYFSVHTEGTSPYSYFADRSRSTYVYTNPTTGLTFTIDAVSAYRNLHIVDNGDGTLTITEQMSGIQRVYGSDGQLLFTDRGLFRDVVLIATNGTVDPDDDTLIEFVGDPFIAGPHDTVDRDFCADFLTYTAA